MKLQEQVYRDAHKKHVEMKERFDREVKDLYKVRAYGIAVYKGSHDNTVTRLFMPGKQRG